MKCGYIQNVSIFSSNSIVKLVAISQITTCDNFVSSPKSGQLATWLRTTYVFIRYIHISVIICMYMAISTSQGYMRM